MAKKTVKKTKNVLQLKELIFTKRHNTGKFEHEELYATANMAEGQDPQEVMDQLREFVVKNLSPSINEVIGEEVEGEEEELPKNKKKSKKVVEEEDDEEEEEEESEDDEEESEDEEPPKSKKASKTSGKSATPKKKGTDKGTGKFRSKPSIYDNTIEIHKKLVGEMLDSSIGKKWRKKAWILNKVEKASKLMSGKPFLDGDGDVLPEFEKSFLKIVG